MTAPILQATGLVILLYLFHYTYLQYRRRIFTALDFAGWSTVWLILIVMELFPQLLEPLVSPDTLFFRILDVIIVSATAILLAVSFYTYRKMRIIEEKMGQMIQAYACEKADEE